MSYVYDPVAGGVSAGAGALGGASAGAMIGAAGGPIGMVGGAVIGGVLGAVGGFSKKKKKKKYPIPSLTPLGMQAQNTVRNAAYAGMSGEGMFPGKRAVVRQEMTNALTDEYQQIRGGLMGSLRYAAGREDRKVRDAAFTKLDTDYARTLRDINEQDILNNFQDRQMGVGLGLSSLAQERRVATSVGDINYQSQMNAIMSPTFQTELNTGLGGAAGYFAARMAGMGKTGGIS